MTMSMPLFAVSANIQDGRHSPSRKRSHQDYLDAAAATTDGEKAQAVSGIENKDLGAVPAAVPGTDTRPDTDALSVDSPLSERSLSPCLTDTECSTAATRLSMTPNATPSKTKEGEDDTLPRARLVISLDAAAPSNTAASASAAAPAAKRKRLTAEEKEEKAKADAARKQEREEQKAAAEAKKRVLAEEREKKRKQKEEEDRRKTEEKERKRREKEEEERKVQEAKEKKERSQPKLNFFFKKGGSPTVSSMAKKAATATDAAGTLSCADSSPAQSAALKNASVLSTETASSAGAAKTREVSEYDRIFKPFFVKENVIMATSLYGLDDETKETKSRILDEYLSGARGAFEPPRPLNVTAAMEYFHLPCRQHRGRRRPTVRKVMTMLADADSSGGFDQANSQTKLALGLLRTIPMKFLGFREDVRPAYYGTATNIPPNARLSKLARNPLAKSELPLNYDYDSEAEWVDDGDGEDVDDLEDDEEEVEEDEEMADFLDDSEDALPARAAFSGGGMEPESTGLCWEDERKQNPLINMSGYRLEFILDHKGPLDPLSTSYWETAPQASDASAGLAGLTGPARAAAATAAAAAAEKSAANGTKMAPPPGRPAGTMSSSTTATPVSKTKSAAAETAAPADAFAALGGPGGKADPKKAVVAAEFVQDFKKAIMQYAKLSKLGIVEILSVEFEKCTKSQIKNSLEAMAERTGAGQHKTWKLKDGVAL